MSEALALVVGYNLGERAVITSGVLELEGLRPAFTNDRERALQLVVEQKPALVLLGCSALRLDSLEMLKVLRATLWDVPVIYSAPEGAEKQVIEAFRLGADDYVALPIVPEAMRQAVRRAMDGACSRGVRLDGVQRELVAQLARIEEQLQRRVREFDELYGISKSVTSLMDREQVLIRIVEAAVRLAGAEEGLLLLLDRETQDLYLRAAKNVDSQRAENLRIQVEDSLAGRVIRSAQPVMLTGERLKVATGYLVKALLYLPLRAPDRGVVGVLGVANREIDRPFETHNVEVLSTLADYAAIAIENARLFCAVESEREKLGAILHQAQEAVIVIDHDQRLLLCNAAARETFHIRPDAVDKPATMAIQHPGLREFIIQAVGSKHQSRTEVHLENGRTLHAQLSPIPAVGWVLMMQDITHLKELDRIKSEFVATVSHDLRTPLTSIQGYVDLLARVGPLNEQQELFISRVQSSMSTITDLIGDLLDIGRIEAGFDLEMEPCDLDVVIDEVVELFRGQAAEKRQSLHWQRPERHFLVTGNSRRLRQVMENLISNAIKYTPAGGWIEVGIEEDNGHVIVHVVDGGIGIPPAAQPFIFDKFYRVESEETSEIQGTGLGLAIVRSVIEKHNGRVWVESRPGVGSTFTFVLHAARP